MGQGPARSEGAAGSLRGADTMVVAKGAVRTARVAATSMELWSRRGMPWRNAGTTETAVRSLVSRAREGTAGQSAGDASVGGDRAAGGGASGPSSAQ